MKKQAGKVGKCSRCKRDHISINSKHPKTKKNICRTCYRAVTGKRAAYPPKKPKAICPICKNRIKKNSRYRHPKTGAFIHSKCYEKITGERICKKGLCPRCGKGPRDLPYLDPKTGKHICNSCYRAVTGKNDKMLIGICPSCRKGPRRIPYLDPDDNSKHICLNCWQKKR